MNSQYIRLNQKINEIVKAPGDQGRIVAMAVAFAIAAQAPLPSAPVDNTAEYYANQVQQAAIVKISQRGEGIIFASKSALEYVETFWKQRYYTAHPAIAQDNLYALCLRSVDAEKHRETFDFATIMSGGLLNLSIETVTFMNKYKLEIAALMHEIHWHMKPTNESDPASPVAIG